MYRTYTNDDMEALHVYIKDIIDTHTSLEYMSQQISIIANDVVLNPCQFRIEGDYDAATRDITFSIHPKETLLNE